MIDEILEALSDGKWHSLAEVAAACTHFDKVPSGKQVEICVTFLEKYGFLSCREQHGKILRLNTGAQKFLQAIKEAEGGDNGNKNVSSSD